MKAIRLNKSYGKTFSVGGTTYKVERPGLARLRGEQVLPSRPLTRRDVDGCDLTRGARGRSAQGMAGTGIGRQRSAVGRTRTRPFSASHAAAQPSTESVPSAPSRLVSASHEQF